jgi:hypothetical protein
MRLVCERLVRDLAVSRVRPLAIADAVIGLLEINRPAVRPGVQSSLRGRRSGRCFYPVGGAGQEGIDGLALLIAGIGGFGELRVAYEERPGFPSGIRRSLAGARNGCSRTVTRPIAICRAIRRRTNSIEGAFDLFKQSLGGAFHKSA